MIIAYSALLVLVLILTSTGIPLCFLLGAIAFALVTGLSTGNWGSTAYYSLESFSLLAIPLFILAGLIIEKSGIGKTLVDLGERMLRKVKGGMPATIPVVSAMFGALCGSSLATASTMCTMIGPRLEEKGWDKSYIYASL
ncbi:MAG: TRAP transporter large permease subunit [Clostridia bacterium]|nr:TRAP transporter large permease subunit [Clostridia bacterium]